MARNYTKPLTGTDEDRLVCEQIGFILPDELHGTRDSKRLFIENGLASIIIAPVWHGTKNSQAAMLAINTSSSRKCHPFDMCYRSDLNAVAICASNRGEAAEDWFIMPLGGQSSGHYEPVANGDIDDPEIVFAEGDVVMVWTED